VIDPSVLSTVNALVTVELRGEWTAGMTVVDFDPELALLPATLAAAAARPRTKIARELDRDRFWNLVIDAVARLSGRVPGA